MRMLMSRRDRIIDEVIDKFPNVGNRTLARLLVEQYPELYTIERARHSIRYRFGATGSRDRKKVNVCEHKKHCSLQLPPGINQVKKPLKLNQPGDWLVISDLHIPYHDEIAIETCIRYAVDKKIKNLYLNGDCVDFYKFSDFVVDPRQSSPSNELELLKVFLKSLKKQFKGKVIYKIGNHEDRYERYLYQRASAVVGIEQFELDKVLGLGDLGITCVSSKQHSIVGNLCVFHGHELPKGMTSPANPAKSLFTRTGCSGVVGHHHYLSHWCMTEGVRKVTHNTYSIGCLCKLVKDYSPVNNWNHGFGHARVNCKRKTEFRNFLIDRGQVECQF
jgi:metallophosphoesterase superfamily enzyme